MLDAAETLDDLRTQPGNRLESLKGDRAGQHSIRINPQWRICFIWTDAGPQDVEIVDHHHLAVSVGVPPRRINEIVHGKRHVTADTVLRLSSYFGTSDRFWLNLQTRYDVEARKDVIGADLDQIRPLETA